MPHAFKDRDIRRLVKAAKAAGIDPVAIEVDLKAGRIKVTGDKSEAPIEEAEGLRADKALA
jgi:hypothetical protein